MKNGHGTRHDQNMEDSHIERISFYSIYCQCYHRSPCDLSSDFPLSVGTYNYSPEGEIHDKG